jgi:protein transport protein SEC20
MRSRGEAPLQVTFILLTYLPRTRVEFRNAQLQAKRNAEAAKRKERELLFSRSQSAERRSQSTEKLSHGDIVKNASSDVTAALRRTHQLMQAELSRSQFAHQTLGWLFLHWETPSVC